MFVLTAEEDQATAGGEHIQSTISALRIHLADSSHALALPLERTTGDEFQLVSLTAAPIVTACLFLLAEGRWAIGVGIGPGQLAYSPRASRGPAFVAARAAVEAARRRSAVRPIVIHGSDPEGASHATAIAQALAAFVMQRSAAGHSAVAAVSAAATQQAAAHALGITQQALSQRLTAAHHREVLGLSAVLERGLSALDALYRAAERGGGA